jgi:hypothetical protein
MVVCDTHYYIHALDTLKQTLQSDNLFLYVFCDDPANLPIDISFIDIYPHTRIIFDDYYIAS